MSIRRKEFNENERFGLIQSKGGAFVLAIEGELLIYISIDFQVYSNFEHYDIHMNFSNIEYIY